MDNTKRSVVFVGRPCEFTRSLFSKGFGITVPDDILLMFEHYVNVTSDEGKIADARGDNASDGGISTHGTEGSDDSDSRGRVILCSACMFTYNVHTYIVSSRISNPGHVLSIAVLKDPRGINFNTREGMGGIGAGRDMSIWAPGNPVDRDWELIREMVYSSNEGSSIGIVFEIMDADFPDTNDEIIRALDECIRAYDVNKDYIKFAVIVCETRQVSIDAMFISIADAFWEMERTPASITSPLDRVARSVVSNNSEIAEAARELEPLYQSAVSGRGHGDKKCILS